MTPMPSQTSRQIAVTDVSMSLDETFPTSPTPGRRSATRQRSWDHPLGYALLGYATDLRELHAVLPPSRNFLSS